MSESEKESGTPEVPLNWEQALSETLKAASEPDPSTEAQPEVVTEEVAQPEERVEESKDALQPLEKWPDDVKTLFTSLDAKAQAFLLDREKDVESHLTKRTQELSEVQKKYERLDDVLKPYDEVARRQGVDLTPHLAAAMQHYMAFRSDPASTLRQLIQQSQLSQEQLFGNPNEDPAIRALRERTERSERELANLRQGQTLSQDSQLASQVAAFKEAKDEKGNLTHPHFEAVRELMAPLVGQGKSMDEAYNQVVWTIPEVREAHEKAARAQAEKEAKAAAEKARVAKVKSARSAETLPSSDTEKSTAPKKVKNWEEALLETHSRLAQ